MSDNQTLVYKKKKKKFKVFPIVNAILFIIIACAIMIPIYKVIITSIDAYSSYDFRWLPQKFSWGGYRAIVTRANLYHPFLISVITTVIGTFVGLLVVTLGGYVLIQWEMPGRNFFAYMLLFTMIFDGGMIPKFLVIKQLGLINTLWSVILPMAINVYNLVLMRNFFEGIPESLFEAAQIDGASQFQIFFKIVLPLGKPILIAMGLLSGLGYWNDWTNGLYYIRDTKLYGIQNLLNKMISDLTALTQNASGASTVAIADIPSASVRMAIAFVAMLPILCLYPFLQRYFTKGIALGAVKG